MRALLCRQDVLPSALRHRSHRPRGQGATGVAQVLALQEGLLRDDPLSFAFADRRPLPRT